MTQHLLGDVVVQVLEVLLGDQQGVNGSFGLQVVERHAHVVFVNDLGGDFAGNDLAEYAIAHVRAFP